MKSPPLAISLSAASVNRLHRGERTCIANCETAGAILSLGLLKRLYGNTTAALVMSLL